jgi:hypothetical protein
VDTQGYELHETNRYRVPDRAIGSRVYLCIDEDRLEVYDWKVHRLAEHQRLADGAGGRADLDGRKHHHRHDLELLAERLGEWGQVAADFAAALRTSQHYAGVHMARLLNLQLVWSADDIVKAMQHALLYHALDAAAVERILRARFRPRTLDEQIAQRTRCQVRSVMASNPVAQRPLSDYSALAHGDDGTLPANPDKEKTDEGIQDP